MRSIQHFYRDWNGEPVPGGVILVDDDGVARWDSNGYVIPRDIAEAHGLDCPALRAARDAEIRAFAAECRAAAARRSPAQMAEQRAEARAAHGPGVKMVNVITGERWTT